jgi:stage V sporulation protein R
MYPLPTELSGLQSRLEDYAHDFGLDFSSVFKCSIMTALNQVASYDGFQCATLSLAFWHENERMSKSYAYGLHRIYEMVINTIHATYLLASNQIVDQKLVMIHVYGRLDFFKNNLWFALTNGKMLDEMAQPCDENSPPHRALRPGSSRSFGCLPVSR